MNEALKTVPGARVREALQRLRELWATRSARERRLVAGAAGLSALVLLVLLGDWLLEERSRLARVLPRAQAQLAQVEQAASEIASLRAQPPLAAPTRETKDGHEGIPLVPDGLSVQRAADGLHVSGSVAFDPLLEWLARVQREDGLRVMRAQIVRSGGEASVDLTLVAGTR